MHRLAEPGEQRPYQLAVADAVQQLVGDVAGFQIGEDKDVGAAFSALKG